MDANEIAEYMSVVKTVRNWPAAQRFQLVRQVLTSLEEELAPRPRQRTMEQARGLAATGEPPPSDEQVKQWLEEERLKKYG